MESYSRYQHSPQRRAASSEQSQPPMAQSSSNNPGAAGEASGGRASSGSVRSSAPRTSPDKQLSQIEKSVTHLLVATKELLETLTQWSRGQASEVKVSDVYVRLGYEFNLACRAFGAIGVDTTDLGPVPDLLRTILEDTLSQDASTESLNRYLPRIRDIIINLLHGLKRKQAKLRSRQARGGPRQGSQGSIASGENAIPPAADELPPQPPQNRPPDARQSTPYADDQASVATRNTSSNWPTDRQGGSFSERDAIRREAQRAIATSVSSSSMSSSTMQNMPVLQPYDQDSVTARPQSPASQNHIHGFPHPPPPPPKANDAIGMLQRSGELERRASRRFSAYQIQKHLGPTNGLPVLPSSQSSQLNSRGRDVRHRRVGDSTRPPTTPEPSVIAKIEPPPEPVPEDSPTAKTPTDKVRPSRDIEHRDTPIVDKPVPSLPQIPERDSLQEGVDKASKQETDHGGTRTVSMDSQNSRPAQFTRICRRHRQAKRSVLVLNVEALDEVKKHIDESVGGVRRLIEGVRDTMDNQAASIQLLTDRQQQAAKEIARLAAGPAPLSSANGQSLTSTAKGSYVTEIQSLRRDLAVLRQTYSNFSSDVSASMNNVRTKANAVKTVATDMSVPSYEGDAGRARVNAGKKELADESEKLVARVDDLQDLVEDLRKDVVTRGVRPLPRQLEAVGRDISAVTKELKKMQDFLKREKPIWTKIWEKELQQVCEERDQLTMQEDLAVDLEDDLEKATQTFALVEQATKQQALQSSNPDGNATVVSFRVASRTLPLDPSIDPVKAKDSVLGEVRALQPNHENRVEAIERAEKARQKELESRRIGQFQKELGAFVEGGKLKKSGGFEEAERLRKAKDEKIRKEVWVRMQGLNTGDTEEEQPAPQTPKEESPLENGEPDTSALKQDEEPENAADVRNEVDAPAAPSSPPANTTPESPKSASGGNRSSSGPGMSEQDEQAQ
ncbi:hypothetical protein CIRG_03966 [Coccidioides immitis RMSCC 2394]|uniref:Actin interacting protein 3 C-terminal domain-containing protein n=1 Tax=Coccidioides immitis RMSCC 2394 TaxID=404692 RepID=A0A0J6Y965_COCIT|nr:hypothetical protein CIRG_03966 [Coccidioides immitis RMSCC 2394]